MLEANHENFRTVLERRGAYAKSLPDHVWFPRFFDESTVDGVAIETVEVGKLPVPSGRIVLADPFHFTAEFTQPLRRRVPPGDYPVVVAFADLHTWGRRVAYARLRFSSAKIALWELAESTDTSELNVFIGVDSGMVCFADLDTAHIMSRALKEFVLRRPDGNYYDDVLARDIPADANWGEHRPDPGSPLSVILTSSGLGDGVYFAYWGLDENGAPAELVVDFQLFDKNGSVCRSN